MAVRDRRTNIFSKLGCLVASGVLDIWVSSTCFQKSNIIWPQQPPTERLSYISKKMEFWLSIQQKVASIGHLGARNDLTIRISKILMKWGCWGHWGHWGCWSCWGHWGCRCSKDWKINEDFRVIQVLKFSFILMFWKKMFGRIIKNFMLNFSTFSVGGCWGQPMLLFWKQIEETQMSKPPEATRCPILEKILVLLSLRVI